MRALHKLSRWTHFVSNMTGKISAVCLLLLLLNVFYDVVVRYLFNEVSIAMQEMEWHLYSVVFLLGAAFAITEDAHVRVDIFYENKSKKTKAIVDTLGTVLFIMPFCALIAYYGYFYALEAYEIGEKSGDPGGLYFRWIIKSAIPVSFVLVFISSIAFVLRSWGFDGGDKK